MKSFWFLLICLPVLGADLPPHRTQVPSVYRYTNYLNIDHPQGPVRVRVELHMAAYHLDNEVDINLRIYHAQRLITARQVTLFW